MHDAMEELKRAEHLLYVSLKYTRTVDVLKSLLLRLISGLDVTISCLLQRAKDKKRIKEIPPQITVRCELVKKLYNDEKINEMLQFYLTLRKINKAEYKKSNEYRRHVTMTATTDDGIIEVNLDIIKEYFHKTGEYVDYVDNLLNPKKQS